MQLNVIKLTEAHCKEICSWRYPEPYDIYNWPAWEVMLAEELQFADPSIRDAQFAGVVQLGDTQTAELLGYVQYFPMEGLTRLGVGLKPSLCGQGLSALFMNAILLEAQLRNPTHEIDLEVHTWNKRAQKTYVKAGFVCADEYERGTPTGIGRFYCMEYSKNKPNP